MAAPTIQRTNRMKRPIISPRKLEKIPYSNIRPGKRICSLGGQTYEATGVLEGCRSNVREERP